MLIVGIGQPPTNLISINGTTLTARNWSDDFSTMLKSTGTPTIYNVTCVNASTEYSRSLPDGTRKFMIKPRGAGNIKVCFTSGQSGTTYISVAQGSAYSEDMVYLFGVTLYFQSDTAGQVVEIVAWT